MKRRLLHRLRTATPNLFFTLTTSSRTAPTPVEAFRVANAAFALLVKRWRRKFPDAKVEYCLVWEKTKAGWPHIHALADAPVVSKHWLSHTWNELTRSFVTDLQLIGDSSHAIAYITKYLTKDPDVPHGYRRWRRSAGFFHVKSEKPTARLPRLGSWLLLHRSARAMQLTFLMHGLACSQDEAGIYHARDDPEAYRQQTKVPVFAALATALTDRERDIVGDWPFNARAHSEALQ